jgi:hypothetical protein
MKRAALINEARKDKKLSQPELADLVGATQHEKAIEHSSFSAIAEVLGIDRRLLDPALNAVKP